MIDIKGLAAYIEKELEEFKYDKILLKFQRSLMAESSEMTERTKKAGLPDDSVLFDLFTSLHPNMKEEYIQFRKEELKKKAERTRHKAFLIGVPACLILMVAIYLAVSFTMHNWNISWLIIIGIVTFLVDTVGITLAVEISTKKKIFHPIARVFIAFSVMMTATCVFLIGNSLFHIPNFWVTFPAGVFVALVCDAVFAYCTKQMLRNVNYIIYVVFCAAMLYVILGGTGIIPWHPGWIMIPLSLIIDVVYVAIRLINNRKYTYKPEDDD